MIVNVNRHTMPEMLRACQELEARGYECISKIQKKRAYAKQFDYIKRGHFDYRDTEEMNLGYHAAYRAYGKEKVG
ncbi:hypothetical protein [Salibacterium lacus]|uniref:Uncharacterized protein n=1 Tax=Salibacterium lacus TaxID=1898109 RepID=A0ABW5SWT4_9BACI